MGKHVASRKHRHWVVRANLQPIVTHQPPRFHRCLLHGATRAATRLPGFKIAIDADRVSLWDDQVDQFTLETQSQRKSTTFTHPRV
jgi:chloramphenicol O-acetyltransferase